MDKYNVNGIQYGVTRGTFRQRWWNFYERGRSFADGGFWSEAEADLRTALKLKVADSRQSRTYGLHFISYFVNRELGFVLYKQNRFEEALGYLQNSLDMDPTEKTEFYLNLCIEQISRADLDSIKPTIQFQQLPTITNSNTLMVQGSVTDNKFIEKIKINQEGVEPLNRTAKEWKFRHKILLTPGENDIDIHAVDGSGNTQEIIHRIILDLDPPAISIDSKSIKEIKVSVTDKQSVELREDKSKNVKSFTTSGSRFTVKPIDPQLPLYLEFQDIADNRNGIRIDRMKKDEIDIKASELEILEAIENPKSILEVDDQKLQNSQTHKDDSLIRSVDETVVFRMEIEQLLPEMKVFQDHILISGRIYNEFRDLKINDQIKLEQGKETRFCFREYLNHGENAITISALDKANKKHKISYNIIRLPTPAKARKLRAKAILCPVGKEGGDREIGQDDLSTILLELDTNGRFRILETERLDLILREGELIENGWMGKSEAAKRGSLYQADYSIACTIRPTRGDIEIFWAAY